MAILESDTKLYLEPVFTKLPSCRGRAASNSGERITLRQGEYAVREIQVRYETNKRPRSRTEGCPPGMCSVDVNWSKSRTGLSVLDLKFSTTSDTPTGTYYIQHLTYYGGKSYDWIFGCVITKERTQHRWKFQVNVVACPL